MPPQETSNYHSSMTKQSKQKSEILSKCRHENKYRLLHFDPYTYPIPILPALLKVPDISSQITPQRTRRTVRTTFLSQTIHPTHLLKFLYPSPYTPQPVDIMLTMFA